MQPVTHWMPYAWHRSLFKKREVKQAERMARKIEKIVVRKRFNWQWFGSLLILAALVAYLLWRLL